MVGVSLVVLELVEDGCLCVVSTHALVFHVNLVDTTLIDQPIVLIVSDLTLLTSFKLLPCLLFDHSSVGIQILSL